MATISDPGAAQVCRLCGLSEYLTGESAAAFAVRVLSYVGEAHDDCAVDFGEARFAGSAWTDAKARMITRAIAYRAGALVWAELAGPKAGGTYEPLSQEESDSLLAKSEHYQGMADELISRVKSDLGAAASKPFARPVTGSSTFAVASTDRTPSERNDLRDERDDLSDQDTEAPR